MRLKALLVTTTTVLSLNVQAAQMKSTARREPAQITEEAGSAQMGVDLGPEEDASKRDIYVKPPGPVQGGTIKVPHPGAAKGLIRINKDGSYQYKTPLRAKSQAGSFRFGSMAPPQISGQASGLTYKSMYGSSNLFLLQGDYEWAPLRKYGPLGVLLGAGLATGNGQGRLESGQESLEKYTLFVVPLTAFVSYRFEYMRRQWVVPFVNGGITYFGMAEKRDDNSPVKFAGAAAAGGGGGILISISRLDAVAAFTLDREYGIADVWFNLEARAMQGLDPDFDFTTQMISAGITLDF